MKRNIAIAVWFLGVAIVALMLFGCVTKPYQRPDCPYGEPRFEPLEPLPPLKLHDLRFICEGYAYKSPTIKEIIGEKDFN